MKTLALLVVAALLALAGCGEDDDAPSAGAQGTGQATTEAGGAAMKKDGAGRTATKEEDGDGAMAKGSAGGAAADGDGSRISVGESEFGTMLFDSDGRAIYIFEHDPNGATVCYGACADAWPPVTTDGRPVAGEGVDASLLGTVRRRDGSLQVTYARQPLYLYAHERPGEVRCHNVNLNGGFWWVVGPDGRRRA